jgi:general stress protein CsbA
MAVYDEMRRPFIKKLAGLVLMVLGFLLAAAGYRYGQGWYVGLGVVSLALGLVLIVRKIVNRNRDAER